MSTQRQLKSPHNKPIEAELVKERTPLWFDSFMKYSDEKNKIANLIAHLINTWQKDGYLSSEIKILDIGCAGAELSAMVMQHIKDYKNKVKFHCVETRESYTIKAKATLSALGIEHSIIQGNCFDYDFKSLAQEFDLIIASHVAYYNTNAIPILINSLLEVKAKNGFIVLIHESTNSIPNQLRIEYQGPTSAETSKTVHNILQKHHVNLYTDKLYSKVIFLDQDYKIDLLRAEQENICTSKIQTELKYLSEFIIQRPLEALHHENKLSDFISGLINMTNMHTNTLDIETDLEIVIPSSYDASKITISTNEFN